MKCLVYYHCFHCGFRFTRPFEKKYMIMHKVDCVNCDATAALAEIVEAYINPNQAPKEQQ